MKDFFKCPLNVLQILKIKHLNHPWIVNLLEKDKLIDFDIETDSRKYLTEQTNPLQIPKKGIHITSLIHNRFILFIRLILIVPINKTLQNFPRKLNTTRICSASNFNLPPENSIPNFVYMHLTLNACLTGNTTRDINAFWKSFYQYKLLKTIRRFKCRINY